MHGYNRVRTLAWPVVFQATGGHRFTIDAPLQSPVGLVLRCRVEQNGLATDYEVGPYYNEASAGAIIGRTLRWWVGRTGVGVVIKGEKTG
jgi:hypothetical protein